MNNLHAVVKIEDTGELVHVEGDSVSEMLYQIRQTVGEYVAVTIQTLAVLSFLICGLSHTTYAQDMACTQGVCYQSGSIDDISTAGQIHAPSCSGVDCIQEGR